MIAATPPANATIASTGAAGETASKLDAIAAQIEAANQRISSNAASIETAAKRLNTLEDTLDSTRKGSENGLIVLAKADQRLADIQAQIDATKQTQTTGAEAIANVARRVDSIEMAIAKSAAQASQHETVSAITGKSADTASQPALAAISQQTSEPQPRIASAVPAQTGGHITAPDTAKPAGDRANDAARTDLRIAEVEQALAFNKAADINTAKLVAELQAQVSATQQTVAGNTDVIAGTTKRMDTLDASMARMDARIADGERSLTANVATDSDVAKLVAELQASLASLDKRLAGDEQSLTDNSAADAETRIRVGALEAGTAAIAGTTGQLQAENKDQGKRITSLEAGLASVSATAKEALDRAIAAGKLAEGKLLFETVLSEAVAEFAFDKATLPKAAKVELKTLAEKLKAENQNVYIEIQGHTDNVGGTAGNMALGQERAEAVMTYLNSEFGIPLHRMSALSYGESRPVADNKTKSGRAQNRRVVLVVLK
ncbi:MAG: OmpA family protein [Hydrogenophilales bacterium]|nr:OmpA family protein [Hydrogenophilales bacterium]